MSNVSSKVVARKKHRLNGDMAIVLEKLIGAYKKLEL
jgi:hypothetical protein